MKKMNKKGFMLAETLIVTTFVASVLIFLFIQFSNLNNSYGKYFIYNTTEGLYSLNQVKIYIQSDSDFMDYIEEHVNQNSYLNITDCSLFTNPDYCLRLFNLIEVDKVYVLYNSSSYNSINLDSKSVTEFVKSINTPGTDTYRLVASFNDGTFATVRFGD